MEPQDIEAPPFCRGMGVRGTQRQPTPLFWSPHKKSPVTRAFFHGLRRFLRDGLDVYCLIAFRTGGGNQREPFGFLFGVFNASPGSPESGGKIPFRAPPGGGAAKPWGGLTKW